MTRGVGWVRVGADTNLTFVVLGLGLSIGGGLLLASPVAQLVGLTSGTTPNWGVSALWSALVLGALLIPTLLLFANRPAHINLDERLVRVGWRTVPFSEVRHAYRLPGGGGQGFVVQLGIARSFDARLPVRTASLPSLTVGELVIVRQMLSECPIEPRPGMPVRSPLADELGERSDTDLIADAASDAVQPFGRVSYAKPTLLLELDQAIAAQRHEEASEGTLDADHALRAPAAALRGLRAGRVPQVSIVPEVTERIRHTERFGARQRAAEEWLVQHGESGLRSFGGLRALGWGLIVAFAAWPWVTSMSIISPFMLYAFYGTPLEVLSGWWIASLLLWWLGAWAGFVLLKFARMRRVSQVREAAVRVRSRGVDVPQGLRDHVGPRFEEHSFGVHGYVFGLVVTLAFLVAGLMLMSLGAGSVGEPYVPQSWQHPVGWLLLVPVIPLFVGVLWFQRRMYAGIARATVEWRLLSAEWGAVSLPQKEADSTGNT